MDLIICSREYKMNFLKELDTIHDYKFLTFNELINLVYGYIENEAYIYLINKYNYSYKHLKDLLSYIPFIDINKSYDSKKINELKDIKIELINNNLFINPNYKYELSLYNIILKEYEESLIYDDLINKLKNVTNVIVENNDNLNYRHDCLVFKNEYDEAIYVMNEIAKMKINGISLNNIYILNLNQDLELLYKRLSKNYKLPINFKSDKNISNIKDIKYIKSLLNEYDNYTDLFEYLNNEFKSDYLDIVFNLVVNYKLYKYKIKDTIYLFNELLKETKYINKIYEESIKINRLNKYNDSEYVFFVNSSLGNNKTFKDDNYLSDDELEMLNLDTSIIKNKLEEKRINKLFDQTKNISISYFEGVSKEPLTPSRIIINKGYNLIRDLKLDYGYSKLEDGIRLSNKYSAYKRLGILDDDLLIYDLNQFKVDTYDHSYKMNNFNYIPNLSYSSLTTYMKCPFKYFLNKVLKLEDFTSSINIRLGNFAHKILEESYNEDFDFDESLKKSLEENANKDTLYDYKIDSYYFNKISPFIKHLIKSNKEIEDNIKLKNVLNEAKIEVLDGFLFNGKIDKVLYEIIDNKCYVMVVDYKTGSYPKNLKNIEDGFNMQLPTYMYLIKNYPLFKDLDVLFIGVYYQTLSILEVVKDEFDNEEKLDGFSNSDEDLFSKFVIDGYKTKYIKGLSKKPYKTLSDDEFDSYIEKIIKNIKKSDLDIKNNKFDINPKTLGNYSVCDECNFKDVCFKRPTDFIYIDKEEE